MRQSCLGCHLFFSKVVEEMKKGVWVLSFSAIVNALFYTNNRVDRNQTSRSSGPAPDLDKKSSKILYACCCLPHLCIM